MTLCTRFYAMVYILLTCRKHSDPTISLRGEVWVHKTSLTPPRFTKVPVLSQESERPCMCVLWLSIAPLPTILIFDLKIIPTVWKYLSFT